jgi:hypothetical protein
LIWEESGKRDLKEWCITKELALYMREWKLAIHVLLEGKIGLRNIIMVWSTYL